MRSVLLTILGCLLIPFGSLHAAEPVVVGVGEWAPFCGKKLEQGGVSMQILSEAFKRQGVTVQYKWMPWKRAYEMTRQGEVDCTAPWAMTSDAEDRREVFIVGGSPVMMSRSFFFHLKSKEIPYDGTVASLKGLKIGITHGYTFGEIVSTVKEKKIAEVDENATSNEANFKKLLAGRIDVFSCQELVGWKTLHDKFKPEQVSLVKTTAKPSMEGNMFALFSRKDEARGKALCDKLDAGLKELQAEGYIEKLINKARGGE